MIFVKNHFFCQKHYVRQNQMFGRNNNFRKKIICSSKSLGFLKNQKFRKKLNCLAKCIIFVKSNFFSRNNCRTTKKKLKFTQTQHN